MSRERPILFSAPMVRAILAGTKRQTRRLLKPQPARGPTIDGDTIWRGGQTECPYGQPGDRLWVRETWRVASESNPFVWVVSFQAANQSLRGK